VADEIEIKFGANTVDMEQAVSRVQSELRKLGSVVDHVGDKIDDTFSKESQKALKEMRSRTRQLRQEIKRFNDDLSPATKQSLGFLVSIQKLNIAINASKMVYGTAARAAIGFADGVHEAIRASGEFIEELDAIQNPLFQFSDTTAENIEKVNNQFDTLLGLSKMLAVQFAGEFAFAASEVTGLLENLALAYGKVNQKILDTSGGTVGLTGMLLDLATGGGYGMLTTAVEKANDAFGFQDEEIADLREQFDGLGQEQKNAEENYKDYVDTIRSSQKDVDRALEKLRRIEMRAEVGGLEGMEKLNELFRQQWQEIDNIAASAMKEAETQEQRAAVIAQHQATILALNEEHSRKVQIQRDKDADAFMKDIDKEIELIRERQKAKDNELKNQKEKQQKFVSDSQNLMKASADVMGDISGLFGEMLENAEGKSRQQLMRLFAMQKASAIAQAAINATLASMSALANPPGPPFTIPIAATVAALGAVQVAQIAAEPPPFHIGTRVSDLAPDEARITRREGLAVLTPQGIAAGGAEAVADANAGITPSSMGQTVLFKYDHRMFDATITDNLKRSNSPLGNAIRRSSYGHRRRNG